MIKKSTLLHLRIPFSFFLMPVFCFAVSLTKDIIWWKVILVFIILHVFLYPASNGFNSYYDKDEESIGGLKHPPKVSDELLWVSLFFDLVAVLLGLILSIDFAIALFIYGLASKAYSYDKIRLKKYPITSWIIAGFFQGFFTFLMTYQALNAVDLQSLNQSKILFAATLTSILLWGFYPMTQIYQHNEDARRGDMTMSRLLGIKGTFIFTAIIFIFSNAGYFYFFNTYFSLIYFYIFTFCLAPSLLFFLWWFFKVNKNIGLADFDHTMKLNMISSLGTNAFFIVFGILNHG